MLLGKPNNAFIGGIVPFLCAALFAALFMAVGWQSINPYGFDDLDNYRIGFQSQIYLYRNLGLSPIEFFLNEAAWVWGFDYLYGYVEDIDLAFLIVTVSSVFLLSLYVIRRTGSFLPLLFFINPGFVDMVVGQIRSGFAAGLFFTALQVRIKWIKILLIVLASSIHTSFMLLGVFYGAFYFLRRMGPFDITVVKPYVTVALITIAAIVIIVFRDVLLASVGDERAFEVLSYQSRVFLSIGFVSFSISYILLSEEKSVTFESGFYLFNVVMALTSALIGVYGSRFVAYGIPVLAVMAADLPPKRRWPFYLQYVSFSALYFFYWII
jgi:hypothetical protein